MQVCTQTAAAAAAFIAAGLQTVGRYSAKTAGRRTERDAFPRAAGGKHQGAGQKQPYLSPDVQRFERGPRSWRTLLPRTPPPSWTPAEAAASAAAEAAASSGLAASRCAELSAAPMANNHARQLFLP